MSKNLSHLALSLRSNNPTAIMLINAIVHEDVGFVRQTTKSDLSKEQKLNIIGSIKVQSYKDQEVKIDNDALFKLATENLSDDGIKIKFLICNFITQAHCSRTNDHVSIKKYSLSNSNHGSMDNEIDSMLNCYTTTKLAGLNGIEAIEMQTI